MDRKYTETFLAKARDAAGTVASNAPQTILVSVYDAIACGDFDAVAELMTADVELGIHGFPPWDGRWQGRSEVLAAAKRNYGLVENQQPELEAIVAGNEAAVVRIRERGVIKSTRQGYSIFAVQWFTFRDGKIAKIHELVASA